jgi:hypothetical protein
MEVLAERYCASCGAYIDTVKGPVGTPPKISGCCGKCNTHVFRSSEMAEQRFAAQQAAKAQAAPAVEPVAPAPANPEPQADAAAVDEALKKIESADKKKVKGKSRDKDASK